MLDREIINALLEIKAVELRVDKENWFTWASGIKSPIYCDNRLTMSYPKIRKQIAEGFVKKIKELYPDVEYIVGTATAGIPHAAWISDIMDLPMLYVRGSAKDHGKTNQIEGKYEKGKKVVVIEDLISTGKSSVLAAQALQEAGLEVLGVVAIFSYNLNKAKEKFDEAKIPFSTLTNYDVLLELAKETGLIGNKENWFTWASGIKSPIYCDNRLTMSYPKIRKQIAEGFVKKIKELYPNVDYIVGTATAGIPHAAWISDIMDLPMLYVRGSAKDH